ncbi:hypothetical protein CRE_21749 [Caenorhabditis remanei]|uniref:SCP domain-containing protein n=1 Tax=Caenorhabditis remanei TaxID=31234 RepID=E3MEM0_CAERE|nr:hypothetical protein CRE_21749 [Caenorhabditis remanei]
MKLLTALGILSICAGFTLAFPEDLQQRVVDYLNRYRESFAAHLPVANMNEMIYNASLERRISSCSIARYEGKDNRVMYMREIEFKNKPNFENNGAEEIMIDHDDSELFFYRQLVNPLYSGVGCTNLKKPCMHKIRKVSEDSKMEDAEDKAIAMCFFGGDENLKPLEGLKRGEPANQCPNGKSKTSRYMCKP